MSIKKFLTFCIVLLFASPLAAEVYIDGVLQGGSGLASDCGDNEIMKWDSALGSWECEADSEGAGGADSDAYHDNVASEITATPAITALADLDEFVLEDQSDSNNKKAITAANIAVYMKTEVQDTFYTETEIDAAFQPLDADLTAIAGLSCTEDQVISRTAGGSWECADAASGSGTVDKTGTINADEIAIWDSDGVLKAFTIGEFDTQYSIATDAELAAFTGQTNIVTLGTVGTGAWEGTAIDGAYIDIAGTTLETTIAADDEVIIYDTSAGANRSMTRGNFVTGIGAGQAVTFDIGDDGGNDSIDVGEIATSGDTNSIFTEPSADKILIDLSQNWPTADNADVAATVTTITGLAPDTATTAAAQPNITSLGTLTTLTIDNITVNGNTLNADTGAVNITPAAGSAIVLDSTINVDAGVVTGATSITSTAFVGDLTGEASAVGTDGVGAIGDIAAAVKSGDDTTVVTGTAGTSTYTAVWNADGDLVDGFDPTAFDPDNLAGDTTDDNLIDQDIIEGMAGVSDPYLGFRDSDAAGAAEADEEAGRIYANMITTTEDAEDSDMWFTIMQGGTRTTILLFDESDDQWETTKSFTVPTEAYDATNWNGDMGVPTKDAVRDKFEGLSGTGTMTTIQDGGSQVGDADITVLNFDGDVFNITEAATVAGIDIVDDGLDSQHYAGASIDPEHVSSGAWDFGTSVRGDTVIADGGIDTTGAADIDYGSADVTDHTFTSDGGTVIIDGSVDTGSVNISDDGDGAITFLGGGDGADEDLTINLDDTANTVVLSSSTGVIEIDAGSFNLVTNGVIHGGINYSSKTAATYTVGTDDADESYGTIFLNGDNDAIDFTLPSAASGMAVCFYQGQGSSGAITVQPNTGDYLVVDGVRGTAATDYTSAGAADEKICVSAADATDWYVNSETGTWAE